MDELVVRLVSRVGDGPFDAGHASHGRFVLFRRPERFSIDTVIETGAITGLRFDLQKGARFRLHSLVVRGRDGRDIYRWAGAGELFRESHGLRINRVADSVGVECTEDGGGFVIGLRPENSDEALEVLLSVSADGAGTAPAERTPDRIADALNHLIARLQELEESAERREVSQASIQEANERLQATVARLEAAAASHGEQLERLRAESEIDRTQLQAKVEFIAAQHDAQAAQHAEQLAHMRTEEGMRHEALMGIVHHRLEAVLQLTEQLSAMRAEEGARHEALMGAVQLQLGDALQQERARNAKAEAQIAQAQSQIADAQAQIAYAQAQIAHQSEVASAYSGHLQAVLASHSWRITGPVRWLVRFATGRPVVPLQLPAAPPPAPEPAVRAPTVAEASLQPMREADPAPSLPPRRPVSFPTTGAITTMAELSGEAPRTLPHTVSVVIPTFNAGSEFYWLLRKLKGQQGLEGVEVVVVDSGSSDGTDTLAEEFGCTVVRIPNSEFSHSHARNLGADNAKGDLLVFTVQDAYPVGDFWLYSLVLALTEPPSEEMRAAAVSCSEFPRRDSELLYNAAIDTHYRFLGCRDADRIGRMVTDDHMSLRTQGQLSDVACMIPMETFQKYRYHGRYAEDLMLGVRLLRDGLKTAMLSSVKVIHSHNRPTAYHLKRTFVDVVFLTEVFPDFGVPPASSAAGAAAGAAALAPVAEGWQPEPGADAAEALRAFSAQVRAMPIPEKGAVPVDFGFAPLGPWLAKAVGRKDAGWQAEAEQVRNMYADRLDHLAGFVAHTYGEVDVHLADELAAAARKTLAATVGAQLAFLYLHVAKVGTPARVRQVEELRTLMTAGI